MHAMTQLDIALRTIAVDMVLVYPQPTHAPLCGIDAPKRNLLDACKEIEAARLKAYCGNQNAFTYTGPWANE